MRKPLRASRSLPRILTVWPTKPLELPELLSSHLGWITLDTDGARYSATQRDTNVDISIKKVGEKNGDERFVLVDPVTRRVLSMHDSSEESVRRFFAKRGNEGALIDKCFDRARRRYAKAEQTQPSVDHAADTSGDDLLAGLGLDDDL